jgi:pyridoxal phosphate enzyme (YggS family)
VSRAEDIARALDVVRTRIQRAEAAAGRPAGSVTLLAVSKTMPPEDVAAALAAGQRDFAENYAQELRDKRQALVTGPRWHFIGPLQSNKVKYVAGQVALLHSLDNLELAAEVDRRTGASTPAISTQVTTPDAPTQDVLIQVNVAGEPQKRGAPAGELPALLDGLVALPRLRCRGLMVIPPVTGDPRPHFAALRVLRDREAARARPHVDLSELSMGMSQDLEAAIAEGATLVRVGTAIFGERRRP